MQIFAAPRLATTYIDIPVPIYVPRYVEVAVPVAKLPTEYKSVVRIPPVKRCSPKCSDRIADMANEAKELCQSNESYSRGEGGALKTSLQQTFPPHVREFLQQQQHLQLLYQRQTQRNGQSEAGQKCDRQNNSGTQREKSHIISTVEDHGFTAPGRYSSIEDIGKVFGGSEAISNSRDACSRRRRSPVTTWRPLGRKGYAQQHKMHVL